METADVLVVGLGAMGSATAYQLAKRGARVIGIDRFRPPHQLGSSSGDTRITRQAVGEGDAYVPLAMRSHELWRDIESETGEEIFSACGTLIVSDASRGGAVHGTGDFVIATAKLADRFGIEHELLSADDIVHRYPQLRIDTDFTGYFEPGGGFVRTDRAIHAQLHLAQRHGAVFHYGETVADIAPSGVSVEVRTSKQEYQAEQVVVATGPWLPSMLGGFTVATAFKVYRQVMYWFDIQGSAQSFTPDRFPTFLWPFGDGEFFYGFPAIDGNSGGVKVATDDFSTPTTPVELQRKVTAGEPRRMHEHCIAGRIPGLSSRVVRHSVCMLTVAPRFGFIIDQCPDQPRTWLVSACSGHGFKHSPAIGEAIAQQTLGGRSDIDISSFSLPASIT